MPSISIGPGFFPIITTVFWIWMLVDCILNKKMHGGNKIFWFLIILFTNFIGAVIYYFMECEHRNPIEALNYYSNAFTKATRSPTPTPPLYTPPSQPKAPLYTPPIYTPPASEPSDYALGYRAQKPAPPSAQINVPSDKTASTQAEYEDTIISYPEMPPPQQGG